MKMNQLISAFISIQKFNKINGKQKKKITVNAYKRQKRSWYDFVLLNRSQSKIKIPK